MNNPALQSLPHLVIVDYPACNRGSSLHGNRQLHLQECRLPPDHRSEILLEDLADPLYMEELQAFSVPVYCLITKSDKKDPTEMEQVKESVQNQILQ